jgi:hypothetical protein
MKLYHATPESNIDAIRQHGLKTGCNPMGDIANIECSTSLSFTDTLDDAVLFSRAYLTSPWKNGGAYIIEVDEDHIPCDCTLLTRRSDIVRLRTDELDDIDPTVYKLTGESTRINEYVYGPSDDLPECVITPDLLTIVKYVPGI